MCGIAGVFNFNGMPVSVAVLKRMTDALAHRGPDGEGFYTEGYLGLGHRRLAIIDLSPAGHQPMSTPDGSVVLSYNGEVYNFQSLRLHLEAMGYHFRSRTDSEVVLHAYQAWGPECVHRLNGMFAFALWDAREQRILLARDRYGIKPLYYWMHGNTLVFASEIKAILAYPEVPRRVEAAGLSQYFAFQNIFSDHTLFEGIRLLPPAHILTGALGDPGTLRTRRYWDFAFGVDEAHVPDEEAEEEVYRLFVQAVNRQLVSDVPVGCYLSGGMDSGSVTAVASSNIPRLTTFTGGFDLSSASGMELGFDERGPSEMMSHRFKTEHYEVVLKAGDMEAVMPAVVRHLEDLRVGQCYPNYYVARLASRFVKVVLSGAGGDELFGGYPWRYYRATLNPGGPDYLHSYYAYWQRLVPDEERPAFFAPDVFRATEAHPPFEAFAAALGRTSQRAGSVEECVHAAMTFEARTFLHGLLLVEDKLSMAHGLETRVPFLDDDLVAYAQRLPARLKVQNLDAIARLDENELAKVRQYYQRTGDGKIILRRAMARLIPKEVTEATKQGFSGPDASWFRGESIAYVRGLLLDRRARLYDYLQPDYVRARLDEHCAGRANRRLLIWSLLSFEWWLRIFVP